MKKVLFTLLLAIAAAGANAQTADAEKVRELVNLIQSSKIMDKMMQYMEDEFRKNVPGLDSTFYVEMRQLSKEMDLEGRLAPLYAKYYTNDEISQLVAFYKTPLGKKMIAVLPDLTMESTQIGQKWGQELGEELYRRFLERKAKKEDEEGQETIVAPPPPPPPAPRKENK